MTVYFDSCTDDLFCQFIQLGKIAHNVSRMPFIRLLLLSLCISAPALCDSV